MPGWRMNFNSSSIKFPGIFYIDELDKKRIKIEKNQNSFLVQLIYLMFSDNCTVEAEVFPLLRYLSVYMHRSCSLSDEVHPP